MLLRLGILFIASIMLVTGCQQNPKEQSLPSEDENKKDRIEQIDDSDPMEKKNLSNTEIAAHLSNVATKVPQVNDAASVVAGSYAVVGIDVDKDLNRSRTGSVKYSVLEAMKEDPYGKTAVVVADSDVVQRLRNMGDKISQGYPVRGVVDELSAIVGRYMPQFPVNENRPDESDQNKRTVPKGKEKQLDDTEEDQSNQHNKE